MFQPFAQDFARQHGSDTSLAELMSAFSYALDLTEGQPEGHSIRCCWIAMTLAQTLGLTEDEQRAIYYAVMLKDLGCSSNAARIAEIYRADDRAFKHAYKLIGTDLGSTLKFVFAQTAAQDNFHRRADAVANILQNGEEIARSLIQTRCMRGADVARMLRFPEPVALAIAGLDEYWDGSGKPNGIAGHAIPLGARLALLSQVVDVFFMAYGPDAARAEVARRSGGWLDPELCDTFLTVSDDPAFWSAVAADDIDVRLIAMEPAQEAVLLDEAYLDDIAIAFGQVIDAKSPYTSGHSERVGLYCDHVSRLVGYDPASRRTLRRAAILHDVGKLGVSSAILEKPGKLDADEWHVMQSHATHTMHILSRIGPMRDMAAIAAAHHGRADRHCD